MEKIKNPDGLNKLLAFSIKNIKKTDYEFNKKVSAEEKLDDFETYKRISEEVFQTPEIENFSEKNKIKGYLELKSVGLQKQKKEDVVDIKNVKDRLNLGLKDEIFTILSKLSSRENEKTKDLQGEINEFLEKFSELS